jgi:biopolymer transport protein ExbB/TolQ
MILHVLMELERTAQITEVGEPKSGLIGMLVVIFGILFVFIVTWGPIIWGILWLVRYLKRSNEERQRLRMEFGKLAEEVSLIRKELKECKISNSSTKSG